MVKITTAKNKIDKPYLQGPAYIRFGEGFDNVASIIELAINTNVIKKAGASLKFEHNGKLVFNVIGKEQLRAMLYENEDLLKTLSGNLIYKEDEETKLEAEEENVGDGDPEDINAMLEQASENFTKARKDKKPDAKSKD